MAGSSSRAAALERPSCPLGVCGGSGWILGPEDIARPCECQEIWRRRRQTRGVASAIPERYRGVSFDRPPVSDMVNDRGRAAVVKAVREYSESIDERLDEGRGLWFMGDVGTGKTTLAMLASKAAIEAGRSVAIYSLPKLLTRIRATYGDDYSGESYAVLFDRLCGVDLLHVDDLGAESKTDWVMEQLYAIINERYEAERSMVVTTNLDQASLEEQIGPRTVSRLVEICGDPLPLFGEDLRYRVEAI